MALDDLANGLHAEQVIGLALGVEDDPTGRGREPGGRRHARPRLLRHRAGRVVGDEGEAQVLAGDPVMIQIVEVDAQASHVGDPWVAAAPEHLVQAVDHLVECAGRAEAQACVG